MPLEVVCKKVKWTFRANPIGRQDFSGRYAAIGMGRRFLDILRSLHWAPTHNEFRWAQRAVHVNVECSQGVSV